MALAFVQCLPLVSPSKGGAGDKRGVRPIMVTVSSGWADPSPGWDTEVSARGSGALTLCAGTVGGRGDASPPRSLSVALLTQILC